MDKTKQPTLKEVLDHINKSKTRVNPQQFKMGMKVEQEHGKVNPETNITDDIPCKTGKIALAHLKELPDYYTRLEKMEKEGKTADKKEKWSNQRIKTVKRLMYRRIKAEDKAKETNTASNK